MITPEKITIIPCHHGLPSQRPDLPSRLTDLYSRGSLGTRLPHTHRQPLLWPDALTPGVQPQPCSASLSRPAPPVPCAHGLLDPRSRPPTSITSTRPAAPLPAHPLSLRSNPTLSRKFCLEHGRHQPLRAFVHLHRYLTPHPPSTCAQMPLQGRPPDPSPTQEGCWPRPLLCHPAGPLAPTFKNGAVEPAAQTGQDQRGHRGGWHHRQGCGAGPDRWPRWARPLTLSHRPQSNLRRREGRGPQPPHTLALL